MKFFLLIILLFITNSYASECKIELFSKVYRLNEVQALQVRDIINNTDCSAEIISHLAKILSNSEGTIGTDFLKNELQKDFKDTLIYFSSAKLSLLNLHIFLKDQLLPSTNFFFTQARSLNGLSSLGLVEGEQVVAICDTCQGFGEKTIKIDIANFVSNTHRVLWFSSKIMAKIKVVKASRGISFQQKKLDPKDFYFDEVLTMTPDNVLTSLDNIGFYKTNKTIMENSIISNLDLQAINLINYGTPVIVTLNNDTISLQKSAMPTRSARFGESVELKISQNKNITGKVIDFNKVVIEL